MADGEPEDDDPMEAGVPVIDSRVRVWSPGDADKPPDADEYRRIGAPVPSPATQEAMAKIAAKADRDAKQPPAATRSDPEVVIALIAKLPEFNPEWSEATQTSWFSAFERIAGMK